ncbi:MAG: response regulator [Bradyrhizobium sp.]
MDPIAGRVLTILLVHEATMFMSEKNTVLLVDDDYASIDALADFVREHGLPTAQAGNGAEALDLLRNAPPALILLDLKMPVMDGFEFLARKAEDPELAAIPVVVMTGDPEQAPKNLPTLRKPLKARNLLQVLTYYCGLDGKSEMALSR